MGTTKTLKDVANINEAVSLLSEASPEDLRSLSQEVVLAGGQPLKPGIPLGDSDAVSNTPLRIAQSRVALAALDKADDLVINAREKLRKQITVISRVELFSKLLAVLGSFGVLGTALVGEDRWILVSGAIALMASIANLLVDHGSQLVGGAIGGRREAFDKLVSVPYRISATGQEIRLLSEFSPDSDQFVSKINKANSLLEEIMTILPRI